MTLTWDLFIILFFVIMAVYGFLLGKSRVFNILIHSFVGYVVAYELGSFAFDYLSRAASLSHSVTVTLFGAKVFVFALVVFVLTLNSELAGARDNGASSKFWTVLYGLLAAGLILSSIFAFMGNAEQINLFANSNLASRVADLRLVWLTAPVLAVIAENVIGKFGRR